MNGKMYYAILGGELMNYFEYIETGGIYEEEVVPEKLVFRMIYKIKKVIKNTKDEYMATMISVPIFLAVYTYLFGFEIVLSFASFFLVFPLLVSFIFILNLIQPKYRNVKYRDRVYKNKL